MKNNYNLNKTHDLKDDVGYWLNRLRMEVHQSFEQRLIAYNVSIAQWCILLALYNKDAASIKELSEFIETDKASISRVVERLESKKLVTHKEGKDRRSGYISLTSDGLELVPKLSLEAKKNEEQFFGHLESQEFAQLQNIFVKIFKTIPSIHREGWLTSKDECMTQSTVLDELLIQAKKEQWPYSKTFEALKKAGVTSYEVKLADYDATFYGDFGTLKEPKPEGFYTLTISTKFNKQAFIDALKRHMKKETSYVEWLGKSAAAGIARYVVSMADRTVTYYGINADDFHVEHVPQVS
ncbi:MAG TPA: DUF1398 family protein [Candidatus Babeliales bacterium]|nr:DUF1398 family protein [Candidatus Babeliales bacterium]